MAYLMVKLYHAPASIWDAMLNMIKFESNRIKSNDHKVETYEINKNFICLL